MPNPSPQQMNQILRLFNPPDYVRAATEGQLYPTAATPLGCYADVAAPDYSCHTKAATWLAMARHQLEHPEPDARQAMVRGRIKAAAGVHGLGEEYERLAKQAAVFRRPPAAAETDEEFMLLFDTPAGRERHYRLRSPDEVKAASAYLRQYGPHFTYAERQQMAGRVLDADARLGDGLDADETERLRKQAGRGFCPAEPAARLVYERACVLRNLRRSPDMQEKLACLARAFLEDRQFCHKEHNLVKTAELLDRVDREYRLDRLGLTPPEDVLFGLTFEKLAAASADHVALADGSVYRRQDLRRLLAFPEPELSGLVGPKAASAALRSGLPDPAPVEEALGRLDREAARHVARRLELAGIPKAGSVSPTGQHHFGGRLAEWASVSCR